MWVLAFSLLISHTLSIDIYLDSKNPSEVRDGSASSPYLSFKEFLEKTNERAANIFIRSNINIAEITFFSGREINIKGSVVKKKLHLLVQKLIILFNERNATTRSTISLLSQGQFLFTNSLIKLEDLDFVFGEKYSSSISLFRAENSSNMTILVRKCYNHL